MNLAAQTLATDYPVASHSSSSLAAAEAALQSTCAPMIVEAIADTIKELADNIQQIIEEGRQANRIHFDYYSAKRTLDAFSNVLHNAHRRPKR
jgi:hypothetical protein